MKLCENEEVLYHLGQNCLSRQSQVIRTLDNRLLCWAFLTVLSFLYGCFFGNPFFFLDTLCCGYFAAWAGRQRMHAGATEESFGGQHKGTGESHETVLEQTEKEKDTGFLPFAGWLIILFFGLLFIACFLPWEGLSNHHGGYGKIPIVCAISLLFIKEGAYQLGYKGQKDQAALIVSGYRYSQLPTICTLVACLFAFMEQGEGLSYLLLLSYIFDMLLFCPVFKKSILP